MHKQEEEKEFEKHIKEYALLLHKICSMYATTHADREDLFQEIVIQLWRSFPNFKGNSKVSTWMYRVGFNTAITGIRKKQTHIISYAPENIPDHLLDDITGIRQEEQVQKLYKAVEQLTDIEKAIVMLYMEDRSYEDMEEILGMNQGALRVKMNRVKEKLRQSTKNM